MEKEVEIIIAFGNGFGIRRAMVTGARELRSQPLDGRQASLALLSTRLRRWREMRGTPLKRVAADLHVSVAVVSAWENGTRFPPASRLAAISVYTGIPICRLLYSVPCDCPLSRPQARETSRRFYSL